MVRLAASDELRKEVWNALVKAKGDRAKAAALLGKSERTVARYIHDLNLFDEMDKAGFMRHAGPPRKSARGTSIRQDKIFRHIKKNKGQVDYGELATDMYEADNPTTRQRVYIAMGELKGKGVIGDDGDRWFII